MTCTRCQSPLIPERSIPFNEGASKLILVCTGPLHHVAIRDAERVSRYQPHAGIGDRREDKAERRTCDTWI